MKTYERTFVQNTWNNTNSKKIHDFDGAASKIISFELLREYRRATVVNFDKYAVIKIFERTFNKNAWNSTQVRKQYMIYLRAVYSMNYFSTFNQIQKAYRC